MLFYAHDTRPLISNMNRAHVRLVDTVIVRRLSPLTIIKHN